MVLHLFLLAQVLPAQHFPPIDRPGEGVELAAVIAPVCPTRIDTIASALLKAEDAAEYAVRDSHESTASWLALGCARAVLAAHGVLAHDGLLMMAGNSWSMGAERAFLKVLAKQPANARAAEALSALALHDEAPDEEAATAAAMVDAIDHGARAAPIYRACSELEKRLGRLDVVARCANDALRAGLDSTWQLIRLARTRFAAADTLGGVKDFLAAVGAAHDSTAEQEVTWHLQWFLTPTERKAWDRVPQARREDWVRNAVIERDVRDGQPFGARLAEHFNRLEYVEKNFALRVAGVLHDAMRSTAVAGCDASHDTLSFSHDTTVFRAYARWQTDFDDRGVVWMRWGKPSRIALDTTLCATESWRYDVDGKVLLLTFQWEAMSGSTAATTLRTGMLKDYICALDTWRCGLAMASDPGVPFPLPPEQMMQAIADDRRHIALATTTDDNSVRGDRNIALGAMLHRLWDPESEIPIAVVTYGVPVKDLSAQQGTEGRTTLLDFELQQWDPSLDKWSDTVFSRHFALPDTSVHRPDIVGFVAIASTPGVSSWSLVATQPDHRRGRAYDVDSPGLGAGTVVLSDLIIGAPSERVIWSLHNVEIPLAPAGVVDRDKPVDLYYQVKSAEPHADLQTTVALYRVTDAVSRDTAALEVSYVQSLRAGINEIAPSLDVSRLDKGDYRLEVRLADGTGNVVTRRSARVTLR